ncbi:hypothetical protein KPL74_08465 [Bacillus sp. NP157]|nr:hypothetical protein KPL74_08465 [Bacillus sp. NP157]
MRCSINILPRQMWGMAMGRVLVVAYQPADGKREEVLELLARQHTHARKLGVLDERRPIVCEATNGEIMVVAVLARGAGVEALFQDEVFQDINAKMASVAVVTPVRTLTEASATFIDIALLPNRGG